MIEDKNEHLFVYPKKDKWYLVHRGSEDFFYDTYDEVHYAALFLARGLVEMLHCSVQVLEYHDAQKNDLKHSFCLHSLNQEVNIAYYKNPIHQDSSF